MSKVSIVRIDGDRISQAVRAAIDLVGGMAEVVRPGETVLLKPNWCVVPAEPKVGVVTNPQVVQAVADLVTEAGATPIISDSAARGVDTDVVIAETGYGELRKKGIV